MSNQNPHSKRASLWFAGALLSGLAAPTLVAVGSDHQARVDALRHDGLVATATIVGKQRVEVPYTDRKGRSKTRTRTMISLRYDHEASLPYAAWLAGGEQPLPITGNEIPVTFDRQSTTAEFDAARAGQTLPVVILPTDRGTAETAEFVKSYSNFWTLIAAGVAALVTLVTGALGFANWRKGRAG